MYIQFYLERHLYDSALQCAYIMPSSVCSGTSWSDITMQILHWRVQRNYSRLK